MTLVFPRAMLSGVQTGEFTLQRYMSSNALYGGTTQVREQAEPRWKASFTYAPRRRADHQALQAWLDSLRGGLRTFLAYDPMKPQPVSYPAGVASLARGAGGAFDGTAAVSNLTASGFTLSTLPSYFALKAGDMIGLVEGGRYGLYRIAEDVTASIGGGMTVSVEPRVNPALFTAAVRANVVRPACVMILDPASVSAPRTAGTPGAISFAGIQTVL